MAANFSDADFARKLQAQYDMEAAPTLQNDLKNTYNRTATSHSISDSDSDVTLDPELEQECMAMKKDESISTQLSHRMSDSDTDVTLSPESPDWKSSFKNMSNNNKATSKTSSGPSSSSQKYKQPEKQKNTEVSVKRRHSKIHDMSDLDEDTQEYFCETETKAKVNVSQSPHQSDKTGNRTSTYENHTVTSSVKDSTKETSRKLFFLGGSEQKIVSKTPSHPKTVVSKDSSQHKDSSSRKHDSVDLNKESPSLNSLKRKRTLILDEEPVAAKKGNPVCQYGSKCYRKNPSHLKDFYHPDDHQSPSTSSKDSSTTSRPTKKKSTEPSAAGGHRTPVHVYEDGQPFSFFLTKVHGIDSKYNMSCTMDVKDILSPSIGNLMASCQFNYMFEIPWLMKQYPDQFRSKPLLLVHGFKGPNKASLEADGAAYSNIRFCQARLDMPYGTHHTKMMFLLYDTGMRVVIHTSNMIERDWFQKTQGIWISPLFPKLPKPSSTVGDSPTRFKHDLLEYVSAYQAYQLKDWKDHICHHDMSSARVFIIGSCPGRHLGERKTCFGHMKLRRILHDHGPEKDLVRSWPVLGQYSSVGTLGPAKETWLCTEWLQSLATVRGTSAVPLSALSLQLIFPTTDNVRTSLEGYPAGGSIPYSIHVARKQPYLHTFLSKWKSDGRGRSRAMPHIKTYGRPSPSGKELAWYLVTSANMSKAAWGAMEKKGSQLMIRSYELGVLFLPKFFETKGSFQVTSDVSSIDSGRVVFPLPYDLPVMPYSKGDQPWIWDIAHKELPDTNGNMWCPPGS